MALLPDRIPLPSNRAIMIIWRIRGKIIRTVLCCVVYVRYTVMLTHVSSSYS